MRFAKYHALGNDYLIIEPAGTGGELSARQIQRICDRHYGVGADGLILLESSAIADFRMVYFNADGHRGSMCGNGGRCVVAFANRLGLIDATTRFEANESLYTARIRDGWVSLNMLDVDRVDTFETHVFLDTGSPHHVTFTNDLTQIDVVDEGRRIRYGEPYGNSGTNVNFVEQVDESRFKVRTYERGVENETLSCGTGVTAVALASFFLEKTRSQRIKIETRGGELEVDFKYDKDKFREVTLSGPAKFVFKGEIEV